MKQGALGICAGAVMVLVGYLSAWLPGGTPAWGVWAMIVGSAVSLSAATLVGAINSHVRPARAAFAAIFLLVVVIAGFGVPLFLPPEDASSSLVLGLPLRAAIEIYGVGLLPLLVLPVLFAVEFKTERVDEAAMTELVRRCSEAGKR